MLGVVIDENQPEYERGDFLVRPIIGVDPDEGAVAVGEPSASGKPSASTCATPSPPRRICANRSGRGAALGDAGAAGALLFTCNGRGSRMFDAPPRRPGAGRRTWRADGGFFAAGEIGPVGGRNFIHGFTATMAVFARD